jgi:DNA invertase Pin-like site-specific DNA recombinase
LELGKERRAAARDARRARGQHVGRPKALDQSNADLARRMHGSGESVKTIAATLGVSAATVYRVVAKD